MTVEHVAFRFALSCLGELANLDDRRNSPSADYLRRVLAITLLHLDRKDRDHLDQVAGALGMEPLSAVTAPLPARPSGANLKPGGGQ